jgi:hypothetical protein
MGTFALLAALLAGAGIAPGVAPPASGGERLVLAVVGNERSASAVHGERAVVADPGTGKVWSRRLPGGTLCHGPLMALGDGVGFSGRRGSQPAIMWLPLTLTGEPRQLGREDTITPSARPGSVWLGRWRHVHAAVPGGFVIETRRGLALWDGRAVSPLRGGRGAWPVATGGAGFAWCGDRCESVRVRTPAGERAYRSPRHLRLQGGAGGSFSPDGRRLALPVTRGTRTQAAVLDLRSGHWSIVPGGALSSYGALAWSSVGDRLYLASAGGTLRAWRPGTRRAERLPVDPGGTVMSIAVTG